MKHTLLTTMTLGAVLSTGLAFSSTANARTSLADLQAAIDALEQRVDALGGGEQLAPVAVDQDGTIIGRVLDIRDDESLRLSVGPLSAFGDLRIITGEGFITEISFTGFITAETGIIFTEEDCTGDAYIFEPNLPGTVFTNARFSSSLWYVPKNAELVPDQPVLYKSFRTVPILLYKRFGFCL